MISQEYSSSMRTSGRFMLHATRVAVAVATLVLILMAPSFFTFSEGTRTFDLAGPIHAIRSMIDDVGSEDFFVVLFGLTPRNMADFFPDYFSVSLLYLLLPALCGTLLGLILGIPIGISRSIHMRRILHTARGVSAIPDFIIVMIIQMIAITIFQLTQVRVGRIAYGAEGGPVMLLPMTAMIIFSSSWILQASARHAARTASEEYIRFALAKGLARPVIVLRHMLPAVVAGIRGDIMSLVTLEIGSLFIIERMFSIPGLTRLLFSFGFTLRYNRMYGIYQYTVNFRIAFAAILLLSIAAAITWISVTLLLMVVHRLEGLSRRSMQ